MPRPSLIPPDLKAQLEAAVIPRHIAIIPDGNRRWALSKGFLSTKGHEVGAENVIDIVLLAQELKADVITFFAFSTENWKRSFLETTVLMQILERFLVKYTPKMIERGVRFCTIGELTTLSDKLQRVIQGCKDATASGKGIDFVLAINYGGRDELCRAVKKFAMVAQKSGSWEIDEERFQKFLDTALWPDPELMIRTSGELRASNFLLWQTAYTEWVFKSVLWPDFTLRHFCEAILEFQGRNGRLGSV